ncbi:hypothetical protein [Halorussus sp. MSC15.2]|uniref:DUF7344 domain-containing protein n=1 Tax=Halorussus sp. MSC15.2 TaxID=2283638 RepID=UPI0013D72E32|nr:hypothetical protein [Halorussus sp. MSC15.2]NEU58275.1 hypothetical protein [Halorussus sp. MSC15.2]
MQNTTHSHTPTEQSLDTIFELVRNPRRRYAISVLSDRESPLSVSELAAAVARRTEDPDLDRPPATPDEVAGSLHHVHLPKMADANVVAYDAETGEVSLARADAVAPFVEAADDFQ